MSHISIDLETASSASDAAVMAIGAASSDGSMFKCYVHDPEGAWDPNTIRWLARQSDPVAVVGSENEAAPLVDALQRLARWLTDRGATIEGESHIWTHATFDMPVLETAYRRAGLKRPWHYRNCRDLRTLYFLAGGRPQVEHKGKHDALNDAEAQLAEVLACLKIIEAGGAPQGGKHDA